MATTLQWAYMGINVMALVFMWILYFRSRNHRKRAEKCLLDMRSLHLKSPMYYRQQHVDSAVNYYFGKEGSARQLYESWLTDDPDTPPLHWVLFMIQCRAEMLYRHDPDQIVYTEKAIKELFSVLGYEVNQNC